MSDFLTAPERIDQWKQRLRHDNPYIGRVSNQVAIWFRAPQSGVSQDRMYLWTGSGLKPEERVSSPKTFESPAQAVKEIRTVVVPHIQR